MAEDEGWFDDDNLRAFLQGRNRREIVIGKNCLILPPDHPEFLHCLSCEAPRYADTLEVVVEEL